MKRFLPFLKPYIKEIAAAPLFKMTEALFELFVPLVIGRIIDRGIASGDTAYTVKYCLVLALLALAGLAFSVTAQFFAAKAAVGFSTALRKETFSRILSFSYAQLDEQGISTLITRLTSDINTMQDGVNLTLRLLLRSPFVVFGAMIMAFTVDGRSALTFAVTVPVLALAVFGIILPTMPLYKKVREGLDFVTLGARRALSGVRVIRAFCKEDAYARDFRERTDGLYAVSLKAESISALLAPVTYVLINLATAALIYTGALRVNSGALSQGSVVALYNYMGQILVELIKLANLIITITKACAGAKRVSGVLATQSGMTFPENGAQPDLTAPAVEMKNVSFTYPGSAESALDGVSFTLNAGESLGIIGTTGSGKTTLASLIPRFYDTSEGEVRLFGRKVSEYSAETLLSLVSFVPQKACLFAGTIRENLLFGCENADESAVNEAINASQSADVIAAKKDGPDEKLDENGAGLSGGQRQRLTVARALVRRTPVLILDDSSSALDVTTDGKMRGAIAALPHRPTVITVSQRVAGVARCDKIAVLDDGRLAGFGTHAQLTETCEAYREICESQKGGENDGV